MNRVVSGHLSGGQHCLLALFARRWQRQRQPEAVCFRADGKEYKCVLVERRTVEQRRMFDTADLKRGISERELFELKAGYGKG